MVAIPNYDNLITEIAETLTTHYRRWVASHPSDEIYAYVIYAHPLVSYMAVSVLTEQGLQQVAARYRNEHGYQESLEQPAHDLRWSVADTPYCAEWLEIFDFVNTRLRSMMPYLDSLDIDEPAWSVHIDHLYSILVSALNQFRRETLQGAIRPMLYVDFGDMSDEERLQFIEQCNAPEVVEAYRLSLESRGF